MPKNKKIARLAVPGAAVCVGILWAARASAHVGIAASSTAAGAFTVATVSVPHGCDGSPTPVWRSRSRNPS